MPGPRASLLALACSCFVYVTAETMPVGLLPEISSGLGVRESTVGLLLTSYAAVAGLSTLPLTSLALRVPRHRVMVATVAVYAVAQLAAALSPTFALLTVSRLVCALAHGVFWSAIAPVAARLVPPGHAGRATSTVFVGTSLALVLGVPLGTVLGQLTGWRYAFGVLAGAGVLSAAALLRWLPPLPALGPSQRPSLGAQLHRTWTVTRTAALTRVCGVTLLVVFGNFTAYTYVAPLVRRDGGPDGVGLSALLLGYGLTGLVATVVTGRWVDRRPGPALGVLLAMVALALSALATVRADALVVAAVLGWGAGFTAIPVCLQAAVLRVVPDEQDTGSAVYVVAFQIGIGGGAFLGERLFAGGYLDLLPVVAATLTLLAASVVLLSPGAFPARAGVNPG